MHLISAEELPHFENMIYLPMLLIILEKDRDSFEKGPFKLKGPYVKLVDEATRAARAELRGNHYLLTSPDYESHTLLSLSIFSYTGTIRTTDVI